MKKLLIILISFFVLLTAVACIGRRAAPAESGTTEESLEGSWWITEEKIYPPIDRAVFDGIEVGKSLDEYSELLSGHKCEEYGYRTIKYYCTDESVMYVTLKYVWSNNALVSYIVSVSPEFEEVKYDRATVDKITVGMTMKEVSDTVGDIGINITSGIATSLYKCTDGSTVYVVYDVGEDDVFYVTSVNDVEPDESVF